MATVIRARDRKRGARPRERILIANCKGSRLGLEMILKHSDIYDGIIFVSTVDLRAVGSSVRELEHL
jgi:hypothetical protein